MKMLVVLVLLVSVLLAVEAQNSSTCLPEQFPCDDGTCIDKLKWCDSREDCDDDSDENYCIRTRSGSDPNKCKPHHFKCHDGPCIPISGHCDGIISCSDESDEFGCGSNELLNDTTQKFVTFTVESSSVPATSIPTKLILHNATHSTATSTTRVPHRMVQDDAHSKSTPPRNLLAKPVSTHIKFKDLDVSKYRSNVLNARNWVYSQHEDFGWGEDTPRAILSLFFANNVFFRSKNRDVMLMEKQLHLRLSVHLLKNETTPIALSDLSLYVNSLLATCNNPRNFHGLDLVGILRHRTDAEHNKGKIQSPLVYMTLCIANETSYADIRKIREMASKQDLFDRLDIAALATLASACIVKYPKFESQHLVQEFSQRLLQRMSANGMPYNIYTTALIVQALNAARLDLHHWNRTEAVQLILDSQDSDGSFGDILAAYYVLPILTGKSSVDLKNGHCYQNEPNSIPIDVWENDPDKIYVQYSLYHGNPIDVSQTLQFKVPKKTHFLDIMRLAQETNTAFRFECDHSTNAPFVYSIGGIPNDAERGLFWILHFTRRNATNKLEGMTPYTKDISELVPGAGDHMGFWFTKL